MIPMLVPISDRSLIAAALTGSSCGASTTLMNQGGRSARMATGRAPKDTNKMSAPHPDDERGRVVPFRRREPPRQDAQRDEAPPKGPVEGLEKYSDGGEPDDYRQRMTNNMLALVLCVLLIGAGLWLANTIADLRKKQDCVLSGRRDCADIAVPSASPK
jgi:hypothetical protein